MSVSLTQTLRVRTWPSVVNRARHAWRARAQHAGCMYAPVDVARQVLARRFVCGGSRRSLGRRRSCGSRAGFGRRAARRGASTPDWGAREGLRGKPERPRARDTSRSRLRRGSRPVEGAACRGIRSRVPEFEANLDRIRSAEIEGGDRSGDRSEDRPNLGRSSLD